MYMPRSIRKAIAAVTMLLLFAVVSSAQAQPVAGKTQPDRLAFGSVRVGATVEASVRIYASGDDTAGISFQVDPPVFLSVKQTSLNAETIGSRGTFIVLDITLSVNTAHAAEHSAPLSVRVGEQKVVIPVTVDVSASGSDDTRLLVVNSPFTRFSTDDARLFEPWLNVVKSAKLDCSYLETDRNQPVLRDLDLSKFDVVLLGETGLTNAQQMDITKLKSFISDGGRVIVSAGHFFRRTVEKANELLVPCGLEMMDTEPRGINLFEIRRSSIADHPLTNNVQTVMFHRPSPIVIRDMEKGTVLVRTSEDPGEGFVAVASSGKGEIVGLGTSLWWGWIALEQAKGFDNSELLKNLLTKQHQRK